MIIIPELILRQKKQSGRERLSLIDREARLRRDYWSACSGISEGMRRSVIRALFSSYFSIMAGFQKYSARLLAFDFESNLFYFMYPTCQGENGKTRLAQSLKILP